MSAASYNLFLIKPVKWTCNVTKKRPKGRMWGNQNVGYTAGNFMLSIMATAPCHLAFLPLGAPLLDKGPKSDSTRMS